MALACKIDGQRRRFCSQRSRQRKHIYKMIIPDRNVFPRNIMQALFSPIFTSVDKSYLILIPPVGQIKTNNSTCCQYTGCIEGHVTLTLRRHIRQLSIWR